MLEMRLSIARYYPGKIVTYSYENLFVSFNLNGMDE
jgi:hypothetical protein